MTTKRSTRQAPQQPGASLPKKSRPSIRVRDGRSLRSRRRAAQAESAPIISFRRSKKLARPATRPRPAWPTATDFLRPRVAKHTTRLRQERFGILESYALFPHSVGVATQASISFLDFQIGSHSSDDATHRRTLQLLDFEQCYGSLVSPSTGASSLLSLLGYQRVIWFPLLWHLWQ